MGQLEGKVALVTGGASGIGRASAERLRDEGAQVVIADLDAGAGSTVAQDLGIDFAELDVGDATAWAETVKGVTARHGGLDIAYLNAGIATYPATEDGIVEVDVATFSDEAYRRILGVNVDGVAFGVRAVVPALEARGGGAIVATASAAGLMGWAPDPIYTLTKHAVVGFVRALASQLSARNITINAICPGGVNTPILGPSSGDQLEQQGVRLMEPSQIADALVQVITTGKTGEAWVCLLDRDHQVHRFARIDGLGPAS